MYDIFLPSVARDGGEDVLSPASEFLFFAWYLEGHFHSWAWNLLCICRCLNFVSFICWRHPRNVFVAIHFWRAQLVWSIWTRSPLFFFFSPLQGTYKNQNTTVSSYGRFGDARLAGYPVDCNMPKTTKHTSWDAGWASESQTNHTMECSRAFFEHAFWIEHAFWMKNYTQTPMDMRKYPRIPAILSSSYVASPQSTQIINATITHSKICCDAVHRILYQRRASHVNSRFTSWDNSPSLLRCLRCVTWVPCGCKGSRIHALL